MSEEQTKPKNSAFWMGIIILGLISFIIFGFITKIFGNELIILILIITTIYFMYYLLKSITINVPIHKIIKKVADEEYKQTGIILDTTQTDGTPNVRTIKVAGEHLIHFFKENITYMFNIKDGVYGRTISNLHTAQDKHLGDQILKKHLIKLEEERQKQQGEISVS